MAIRTIEEIEHLVSSKKPRHQPLVDRMDRDYQLWKLEQFVEKDGMGNTVSGFRKYTSNEPRVFAKKMNSWLAGAELIVSILHRNNRVHQGDTDDHFQRWLVGVLAAADDSLQSVGLPKLVQTLPWFVNIRGWSSGVAHLYTDQRGRTIPRVRPWDPRNMLWEWGTDGLDWACNITWKTAGQVRSMYNVDWENGYGVPDDRIIEVTDFWDAECNTVIANGHLIKPPAYHGSPRTPVWLDHVVNQPEIVTDMSDDSLSDVGESIYDDNRSRYENLNTVVSIWLELAARQREQPYVVVSKDGTLTLPSNPWIGPTGISLKEGEKIELLEKVQTNEDAQLLAQFVQGETQRGSIPYAAYGELSFQLSGYAIERLKEGIDSVLAPRLRTIESSYRQVLQLLTDQYMTGYFQPLSVSGRDRGRNYFNEMIDPQMLMDACDFQVELLGQLPQDDMAKMNIAMIARQPGANGMPLFSDEEIREKWLKIRDADISSDKVKMQMAQSMLPEAMLFDLMRSAEDLGHSEVARFYFQQLVMMMGQRQAEMMMQQQGMVPPGAQPSGEQGSPPGMPGVPSQAMPQAEQGYGPPPPGPNNMGGMVAPGTPRPGAQNGNGVTP